MKKISLLAVLLMLVLLASVPAFAAETNAPAGPKPGEPGAAFSPAYGIFIPVQGTPIQLTGGDEPAKSSLGAGTNAGKAFSPAYGIFIPVQGTPIQLTGGDEPAKSCLGAGTNAGKAFSVAYGIFIPVQGTPIQLTGGDEPAKSSLGGR
jgi:hypothetical protein